MARDGLFTINRDRLYGRVGDQLTEFSDREKAQDDHGGRNTSGRYRRAERSPGRNRQDGPNRAPTRGWRNRGRSLGDSNAQKTWSTGARRKRAKTIRKTRRR